MVHVTLLSATSVNWDGFLSVSRDALGRSVANQLDNENCNSWDAASYISALSEIWHPGLSTKSAIRAAGNLLQHYCVSVLLVGSRELALEVGQETGLACKSSGTRRDEYYLTVVTGDLQQWRSSVINCSTGDESQGLREFMNRCHEIFEKLGLGELWSEYRRRDAGDLTVTLLPK
jgi:hypothetical protein